MKRTCKQCGKEFFISQSEINFYKEKNLNIPKRCKECREKNKTDRKDDESGSASGVKASENTSVNEINVKKTSVKKNSAIVGFAAIFLLTVGRLFSNTGDIDVKDPVDSTPYVTEVKLTFSSQESLTEHYEKHGKEMGFESPEEYEAAAAAVVYDSRALHKNEADGDDLYYIEETNEYVVVSSKSGKILSYYLPDRGKEYFDGK